MQWNRFSIYAWIVLGYNVAVIVFGAFVRATHSGAGCGNHWPLCDGEVIPLAPQIETIIEYTHRATSGLALIMVAVMLVWALKAYPRGHRVRFGASLSAVFIIIEALIGAGLVIFGWVGDDASTARVVAIAIHLANTFLLLGAITLTAWWAGGGKWIRLRGQKTVVWALGVGFIGLLLIGMSGAITALGSTLFPAESLSEGIRQDFSPGAHFTVRLRVLHPVISILTGFYLMIVAGLLGLLRKDIAIKRFALSLIILFVIQLGAGMVNLILMAPVWLQLVHLFLADLIWISMVLLAAAALASPEPEFQRVKSKVVSTA